MKVNELLKEADHDNEYDDGMSDAGRLTDLWGEWHDILADFTHYLKRYESENTTVALGGNFHGGVSGNSRMRKDYIEHSRYGSPRRWDYMIEIGNNMVDGDKKFDSIKAMHDVMQQLKDEAEDMKAEVRWATGDKDVLFATYGTKSITAKCQYGRNFCWVGITKT